MNSSEFTQKDYELIHQEYDSLMEAARGRCRNEEELEIVRKAFEFADNAHKNVRRRSSEPYIIHPIEVAKIVINNIGLGYKSIVAALLHDVVEDTEYTFEDIRTLFSDKIASLVEGLTKIKTVLDNKDKNREIAYNESLQAENFKRILLTLNDDARVVLIKLADRLHNCRTIEFLPEHKRDKILSETMFIFIPLAHRLGLYEIKSEMENIWLRYCEPESYRNLTEKISRNCTETGERIDEFIAPIIQSLNKFGIKYQIKKRIKTPYSIWKKMQVKHVPFEEIYDLYAVRIIFDPQTDDHELERQQAYVIFAIVTSLYRYQPSRTRDWIRQPKNNGYEALHCTLMSHFGIWVEVQIRSKRMDDIAEKGIAAHWAYKQNGYAAESDSEMEKWLAHVQNILVSNNLNALELLDVIHSDLVSKEITVFTPKGEQRVIPAGSTALDFAYAIHTDIGNSAIACKINMKLASISQVLKSGDQVEIITSRSAKPKAEWLGFIQTNHARKAITEYLRDKGEIHEYDKQVSDASDKNVFNINGALYRIAPCCNPIPGDSVIGIKSENGIIDVHKKSCPVVETIASTRGECLVVPKWMSRNRYLPAKISLKGLDRIGLLNDITNRISGVMGINMRRLSLGSSDGLFEGEIELMVHNKQVLDSIVSEIKDVDGIEEVVRIDL